MIGRVWRKKRGWIDVGRGVGERNYLGGTSTIPAVAMHTEVEDQMKKKKLLHTSTCREKPFQSCDLTKTGEYVLKKLREKEWMEDKSF